MKAEGMRDERKRFATRAQREMAVLVYEGRCGECGEALPDGFHMDHKEAWARGGATVPANLQPTCPRCNWRKGIQGAQADMHYTDILSPSERPRRGQAALFEHSLTTEEALSVVVLPTGYGKTRAALGAYLILRARGIVDRAIIGVPSDDLRDQWAEDCREECAKLGHDITGALGLKKAMEAAFRHSQQQKAEVFIMSYQQMLGHEDLIADLCRTGKFLFIGDEFHHLAKKQPWGKAVMKAKVAHTLLLSATPIRTDKKPTLGAYQYTEGDGYTLIPDVMVTLKEALDEQAIRRPIGHIQHYFIDVISGDTGKPERITTSSLREEGITNFDEYETRKQLRYVGRYLSRILVEALDTLTLKNIEHPGQHQMLVFAMSCHHAESVCAQLNALADEPIADWVGVTRPEQENAAIKTAYKENRLLCLVQVDMISEGFDISRCSVLVFLHLLKSQSKLLQQLGRGLRRNKELIFAEDQCDVYVSADTELAELIRSLSYSLRPMEEDDEPDECHCCLECPQCDHHWRDIPDINVLDAHYERTEEVSPDYSSGMDVDSALYRLAKAAGIPEEWIVQRPEAFANFGRSLTGIKTSEQKQKVLSDTQQLLFWKGNVGRAVNLATSHFMKRLGKLHGEVESEWAGIIKRQIHAKWLQVNGGVGHKESTVEDLQKKYKWLQDLDQEHRIAGVVPSWINVQSSPHSWTPPRQNFSMRSSRMAENMP